MNTQSFLHSPVPFCTEGEWGGCCGFGVTVTLPVWTSKTLNILPKVTNNSLSFPDDFQYSMCSSTECILQFYCLHMMTFPFFSYNYQCTWRPALKESWDIVPRNKSVCKFENGWVSEPFSLHCSFSKLVLEKSWKDVPGALKGAAPCDSSGCKLSWTQSDPLGRAVGASWHCSIQQGQKQNCKAVATAY